MGGSGNYARFFRPLGEAVCSVLSMLLLGLVHWSLLLCSGVCWAQTTYFKKKGTDGTWVNFIFVGMVFGLTVLPFCVATNSHWIGFSIRFVVCSVLTPVWNYILSPLVAKNVNVRRDITDEFGRGFINVATLPLVLIGA